MQRISAEYTITVSVKDIMNVSDDTIQDINDMIKERGRKIIKEYLSGELIDHENDTIKEQIKITEKGL